MSQFLKALQQLDAKHPAAPASPENRPTPEKAAPVNASETQRSEAPPIAALQAGGNHVDLDALYSLLSEALADQPPSPLPSAEVDRSGAPPAAARKAPSEGPTFDAREAAICRLRDNLLAQVPPGATVARLFTSSGSPGASAECVLDLAVVLADAVGGGVLVVDANFHQPSLAQRFGLKTQPGLVDVLTGKKPWRDVLQSTAVSGVSFLAPGLTRQPIEVDRSRLRALLQDLKGRFGIVLVEAGPATEAQVLLFAAHCDGAYLVVELGRTSEREAAAAVRSLKSAGAQVLGSVITGAGGR
jgi:Mrp family chromosome partitioning ATPase